MEPRGRLCLIACDSGLDFTKRIITELTDIYAREPKLERFHITPSDEIVFSNGEIKTVINENIRGQDVYVVQCVDDPNAPDRSVNDNLMAALTAINAAYNSDAESVTAVLPQYPYSRQERKKARQAELRQRRAAREAQKMFENMSEEELAEFNRVMQEQMEDVGQAYMEFLQAAEGNMMLMALSRDPDFQKFCTDNYILGVHPETGAKSIIKKETNETLIAYLADVVPDHENGGLVFTIVQLDSPSEQQSESSSK